MSNSKSSSKHGVMFLLGNVGFLFPKDSQRVWCIYLHFPHLYYPVVFGLDPRFAEGVESNKLAVQDLRLTLWFARGK